MVVSTLQPPAFDHLTEPEVGLPMLQITRLPSTLTVPDTTGVGQTHLVCLADKNQGPRRTQGSPELPIQVGMGHEITTFNPFDIRREGRRAPRGPGESLPSALYFACPVFQGDWCSYPVSQCSRSSPSGAN